MRAVEWGLSDTLLLQERRKKRARKLEEEAYVSEQGWRPTEYFSQVVTLNSRALTVYKLFLHPCVIGPSWQQLPGVLEGGA